MARVAENGNTRSEAEIPAFKVEMGTSSQLPLAGAVELGTLEGTITADGNGQALAGATVTLTPDRASAEKATVQTGADAEALRADAEKKKRGAVKYILRGITG